MLSLKSIPMLCLGMLCCVVSMIQANEERNYRNSSPHLTPAKLVGSRFPKDTFGDITVALVGYCPPPNALAKYKTEATTEQYFIHIAPSNVQISQHGNFKFLSIYHVYGGPVSAALIEELGYYGIKYVLAYGLAGGLGTKGLKMGGVYLVESALATDGTTPHYTNESLIYSDPNLNSLILKLSNSYPELHEMVHVQAITGDAIYREYDNELEVAIAAQCDVINCDSSHLFAVSKEIGITTTECGVISDVIGNGQSDWDSTLSVMLTSRDESDQNPLDRVGEIVELYVEKLLPELSKS